MSEGIRQWLITAIVFGAVLDYAMLLFVSPSKPTPSTVPGVITAMACLFYAATRE